MLPPEAIRPDSSHGWSRPPCQVSRLRLYQFRNYTEQTLNFEPGLNLITGENGQGKSNLLEAIATIALTKSPRASVATELIAWGRDESAASMLVSRPDGEVRLDWQLRRLGLGERSHRTSLVDGKERPAAAVLGVCPVVLFWPDDLLIIKGDPRIRRQFLDTILSQLDSRLAAEMSRYHRVLEQRNALLKQLKANMGAPGLLSGFTEELAQYGGRIQEGRIRLLAELEPLAAAALLEMTQGHEEISLRYVAQGIEVEEGSPPGHMGMLLARALAARTREEIARGTTVVGPHRDHLEVQLDGRPAKSSASQGQQRSLILACKLAEVRYVAERAQMMPVLLLDDVLSELDEGRRNRFMESLGQNIQTLLSTAEPGAQEWGGAQVSHIAVEAGRAVNLP